MVGKFKLTVTNDPEIVEYEFDTLEELAAKATELGLVGGVPEPPVPAEGAPEVPSE
jgi:hypothetical protein